MVGNGGAELGAGAQEDSVSCPALEFPCIRTNAGSPENTEGALVQPLKSDLKRETCGLMPLYHMHGGKIFYGFFGEENVPGLSISPASSVWPGREGWGCARSQRSKAGVFLSIR